MDVDLGPTVGRNDGGDGGVPQGSELIAFAEAAVGGDEDLDRLRNELLRRVGPHGVAQAAATVSAFSGLVRVADGTGIPIDDGLASVSRDIRDQLDLEKLGGAANSDVDDVPIRTFSTIEAMFGDD